jgi:hypothetical protein
MKALQQEKTSETLGLPRRSATLVDKNALLVVDIPDGWLQQVSRKVKSRRRPTGASGGI